MIVVLESIGTLIKPPRSGLVQAFFLSASIKIPFHLMVNPMVLISQRVFP